MDTDEAAKKVDQPLEGGKLPAPDVVEDHDGDPEPPDGGHADEFEEED